MMLRTDLPQPALGYRVLPDHRVEFAAPFPLAQRVRLSGTFTGWHSQALEMERDPASALWRATTGPLPEGPHFYKFVVDDTWVEDPLNPMTVNDELGGLNSALAVGPGEPLPSLEEAPLRVASLNLHTYQEPEPLEKLRQVAFGMAAANARVLLLQEVGWSTVDPLRPNAGGVLQAELECLTGRPWHHAWTFAHRSFREYDEGLSILSCDPLEDVREHELSPKSELRRVALSAQVRMDGRRLRVVTVHTSWPWTTGEQEVAALLAALGKKEPEGCAATILGGDLNAGMDDPQVQALLDAGFMDCAIAVNRAEDTMGDPPVIRIDYQLLRRGAGEKTLAPRGFARLFNNNAVDGVFLPRVSDHVGILGAYG